MGRGWFWWKGGFKYWLEVFIILGDGRVGKLAGFGWRPGRFPKPARSGMSNAIGDDRKSPTASATFGIFWG